MASLNNTEKLIEEVEKRPDIWDVASEGYSDRFIRRKRWKEIVEIFLEAEGGEAANVDVCTKRELENALLKKWKCIRGCYTRELARQKAAQSGQRFGLRKSEYIYFNKLQFLKNSVRMKKKGVKRERSDSCNNSSDSNDETQVDDETEMFLEAKRVKNEQQDFEVEDDPFQYLEVSNRFPDVKDPPSTFEDDEDKMFLMSLLSTMKKVPENRKIETRIKIMTVLQEMTQ